MHLPRARPNSGKRVRNRILGIVVRMNPEMIARDNLDDFRDDTFDFRRQGAAVGIAQDDPARAGVIRSFRTSERIVLVRLEAIEEMLAIEHRLSSGFLQCADRFFDGIEILFVRYAERHTHVIIPRLGHEAGRIAVSLQQVLEARVVRNAAASTLGHAKAGKRRVLEDFAA